MYRFYITEIAMSSPARDPLSAALTLRRGGQARVGLDRIALVESVAALGSISAAARALGLSYKAAWDAVQALNNLFDAPLIEAAAGGKSGGAARVTPRGLAVVAAFRRVQGEIEAALARLDDHMAGAGRDLVWSLGMKTSARNALRGVVSRITPGAVMSEVALTLADGVEIIAMLTSPSVADLGLAPGRPAIALIDAGFILLAKGEPGLRTSARNHLTGRVVRREDGAVNSEVTLDIGAGKTLTAVISLQSAKALELAVGDAATALIKAPHVILAVE